MSMRIQIETIPHALQRYETTGDWVPSAGARVHICAACLS